MLSSHHSDILQQFGPIPETHIAHWIRQHNLKPRNDRQLYLFDFHARDANLLYNVSKALPDHKVNKMSRRTDYFLLNFEGLIKEFQAFNNIVMIVGNGMVSKGQLCLKVPLEDGEYEDIPVEHVLEKVGMTTQQTWIIFNLQGQVDEMSNVLDFNITLGKNQSCTFCLTNPSREIDLPWYISQSFVYQVELTGQFNSATFNKELECQMSQDLDCQVVFDDVGCVWFPLIPEFDDLAWSPSEEFKALEYPEGSDGTVKMVEVVEVVASDVTW